MEPVAKGESCIPAIDNLGTNAMHSVADARQKLANMVNRKDCLQMEPYQLTNEGGGGGAFVLCQNCLAGQQSGGWERLCTSDLSIHLSGALLLGLRQEEDN